MDGTQQYIFPQEVLSQIAQALGIVANESAAIALPMTAKQANRLVADLAEFTPKNIHDKLLELETRFQDEIENIKFFWVNPELIRYYDNTELAGSDFKEKFPRGNGELIEAGNCLALGRYTACVFHLMRSLEIALIALESTLAIARPHRGQERTWGKTLERIGNKIDEYDRLPPANWASDQTFYKQVRALLNAIKSPYRDSTMHVESSYDEAGAQSVFNVSVEALKHIATKLRE